MQTSPKIELISEALSKAQAVMENAKETSKNPFFHSQYADLAEVWDTARKPLADNGLSIVQTIGTEKVLFQMKTPTERQPDKESACIWLTVTTRLLHTSEQWFEDSVHMPVEADPQSLGKVTTYVRRYALMAMVGIAPEDDDGNAASGKQTGQVERKPVAKSVTHEAPHICLIHDVPFTRMVKGEKVWYSHKDGEAWCNEPVTPAQQAFTPISAESGTATANQAQKTSASEIDAHFEGMESAAAAVAPVAAKSTPELITPEQLERVKELAKNVPLAATALEIGIKNLTMMNVHKLPSVNAGKLLEAMQNKSAKVS